MLKVRNVVLLLFVFGLAACSSTGPSPAAPAPKPAPAVVNLDNDFWAGTATSPDSGNGMYVGFGFSQTGTAVLGTFGYIDQYDQAVVCCTLEGSVEGNTLTLDLTDDVGDQIKVEGTFGTDVKTLTGQLIFVIDGQSSNLTLNLAYDSELTAASLNSQSAAPSLKAVLENFR